MVIQESTFLEPDELLTHEQESQQTSHDNEGVSRLMVDNEVQNFYIQMITVENKAIRTVIKNIGEK